jgi:hypothetical protein
MLLNTRLVACALPSRLRALYGMAKPPLSGFFREMLGHIKQIMGNKRSEQKEGTRGPMA